MADWCWGREGLRPGTVDPTLLATCLTVSDSSNTPTPPQSVRRHDPLAVTPPRPHTCNPYPFPAREAPPHAAQYRCRALRMLRLLPAPPHVKRMRVHALAAGSCSLVRDPANPVAALPKAKAEAGWPKLENSGGRARRRDSGLRSTASSETRLRGRGRVRPRCQG